MRRSRAVPPVLIAAIACVIVPGGAIASVIAGNIPASDTFDPSGAYRMDAQFLNAMYPLVGVQFTPESDVSIELVELALTRFNVDSALSVSIALDEGGLPGTTVATLVDGSFIGQGIMHWTPSGALELGGGTPYWLVARASFLDVLWHFSDPAEPANSDLACAGIACNNPGPGAWGLIAGTRPAFRINGTVIPEPSAGTLLGFGIALLALRTAARGRSA